ncbi:RloB family protein, partial [Bdellovibrionota bacterium FG-2]
MTDNYNFRRQRHPRTVGKRLIIGCEGKETERIYFNAIRIALRIPKERIVVSFNGSSPISVVDNVITLRDEEGQEFNPADGDEAWAVFDGDEHIQANLKGWQTALQKA